MYRQLYQIGGLSSLYGSNTGGQKPIYPRISDIESSLSNAEQKIGDPSLGSFGGTSDGGFSSPMAGVYSQSTGGELPPIQQAIQQGPLQIPSTLINPVRPGVDTSQLGSPRTGGMGSAINFGQLSSLFGGVGDPRLGAPDVPNSLQQIMRGARADGGMMGRQMYGLGSFVKKAVKGVTGAVKSVVKSPIGKAAILGAGIYGLGGGAGLGSLFGKAKTFLGGLPGAEAIGSYLGTKGGKTLLMAGAGTLLGGLAAKAEQGDPEAVAATRDVGALRNYLTEGYRNLGYTEDEIPQLVEQGVSEYSQDRARVGAAYGGRIGYAFGNPEDNAMRASGIMNLPLNQNPAGVTELDLRETGGFIPPVGVKEKADDIPAMLSNNEFVFTAKSVRNMGNGDVNKGAQRMYDMMKYLEKGGRV